MVDVIKAKAYIKAIFEKKGVNIPTNHQSLFDEFVVSEACVKAVDAIIENQNLLMKNWDIVRRIAEIKAKQIVIPNATIGKPYEALIDFKKFDLGDLDTKHFEGLSDIGLEFNALENKIEGTPTQPGDIKFKLRFTLDGEPENTPMHEKTISLVVNPDPKSLWKDIPSDQDKPFAKADDVTAVGVLGDKKIVVASKRGRSHRNVGSYRDDDFAFKYFEKTGWSVVAVSDGAGSYSLSREGSRIACNAVVEYFERYSDPEKEAEIETKIQEFIQTKDEQLLREIEGLAKQNLYRATVHVHNEIKKHAEETHKFHSDLFNNPKAKTLLDYYHATLIFALFKKYSFGYLVLTFGVGDCPIAIVNREKTGTTLLNWLDVGEFGGGTRFITQPDIFRSTEHPMATRFGFQIITDFSFLFLMTDGIYDPKFVVEANLEKHEKWVEFLDDLQGKNDDGAAVNFDPENTEIDGQLSAWMEFWSPGNHDDRTLAIVY